MRKNIIYTSILASAICLTTVFAAQQNTTQKPALSVNYMEQKIEFVSNPIIENGRTLVQLRPIAEALGVEIEYEAANSSIILFDGTNEVRFYIGDNKMLVNGEERVMDVNAQLVKDYTFIPVRYIAEPLGIGIAYSESENKVSLYKGDIPQPMPENNPQDEGEVQEEQNKSIFYFQGDPQYPLDNNGRGYCWVCSYAMILTNTLGTKVTPNDVAAVNISAGYKGSYMINQNTLTDKFGCRLVPALAETSKYYAGYDGSKHGATKLNVSSDEDVYNAIKEALERFPQGVIVRYEGYPHSMVAVEAKDGVVYFNDPGLKNGEHITFKDSCLKNFKMKDISFIQAVEKK